MFDHIDTWNEQSLAWLDRTGNKKVHNTTKKRPVEVFSLEKQHLRPIIKKITISNVDSSITRTVRKDNTIVYLSNRYSVPLGTYNKGKSVFIEVTDEGYLLIRDDKEGTTIAEHKISHQKGKLIQDTQHTRDRTKGIPAYITSLAGKFSNQKVARTYLEEIHRRYPRYIRDQLRGTRGQAPRPFLTYPRLLLISKTIRNTWSIGWQALVNKLAEVVNRDGSTQ